MLKRLAEEEREIGKSVNDWTQRDTGESQIRAIDKLLIIHSLVFLAVATFFFSFLLFTPHMKIAFFHVAFSPSELSHPRITQRIDASHIKNTQRVVQRLPLACKKSFSWA